MLENQRAIGTNILMSTICCHHVLFLRKGATLLCRLVSISLQRKAPVLPPALGHSAVSELKGCAAKPWTGWWTLIPKKQEWRSGKAEWESQGRIENPSVYCMAKAPVSRPVKGSRRAACSRWWFCSTYHIAKEISLQSTYKRGNVWAESW